MQAVNYEKMTCDELREVAKKLEIKGRSRMTKQKLIEEIKTKIQNDVDDTKKDNNESMEAEQKEKNNNKMEYIEKAEIGTIVAFKTPEGKVKSAKIEKRSSSRRVFKLVTQYGAEFIVPYKDIIWVKTNSRWPKGVFNLLKGKA